MPERCYDEQIKEIKDKCETSESFPGPTNCHKDCYIVCKVNCKKETMHVKEWSFTEVKSAKPGPFVHDCDGNEIIKGKTGAIKVADVKVVGQVRGPRMGAVTDVQVYDVAVKKQGHTQARKYRK